MYRTEQKVLERERDIERVYYPNESYVPPSGMQNAPPQRYEHHQQQQPIRQGTLQTAGVPPGQQRTITTYPAGATVITNYPVGTGPTGMSNQQQPQLSAAPTNIQINPNINQGGVGFGGGTMGKHGGNNFEQQMRRGDTLPRRGDTLPRRGDTLPRRGGPQDDNRSECRSCSLCSSDRDVAEDAYRAKKRRGMLGKAFPIAALLATLMICISLINWVGIWTPFWLLARNPFLIYPVTSTTTINTGVGGIGGSGGIGDVPLLLNPQTIQPPGGRVGIGNPIFGHLGIWAYCAPRSFCVTYPYGRARPYGFFSAAAFSLSLAGLGGFFTQLFGGPLLNNLVGGLGFGGGLPGALGPGFSGIGGFGGFKKKKRRRREISSSVDKFYDIVLPRDKRAALLSNDNNANSNNNLRRINNNNANSAVIGAQGFGLNPSIYNIQQQQPDNKLVRQPNSAQQVQLPVSNLRGTSQQPIKDFYPFSYYYDPTGNGLNQKYLDIIKNGKLKEALTTSSAANNRRSTLTDQPNGQNIRDGSPQQAATPLESGSSPVRNNRNLGFPQGGVLNAGQGLIDPSFGGGLGSLGAGGLGALGLGAFGNRFSGINGLLGSQQALVAFALLQPGPEGLPLPENFLFSLPGSISPFSYFRNRIRENVAWFISVQTLIGIGFALNVIGFVLGIIYLCTYYTKFGRAIGKIAALLLFLAAIVELLGICVFIAKVRLDRNAFFHIDPAFVIHSGVGWAFYVSLSGAILLLFVSLLMLWESSINS